MTKKIFLILITAMLLVISIQGYSYGDVMKTSSSTSFENIKEHHLKNGLKILFKQDESIPLVTFSVWYKVGSRNETDGIRGIAHFLEHMMFKGTKKYKKGEISSTIQKHGGIFNAFTFTDGTAYYETVPPEYLEKMVELEADRMKNSELNEEELNLEKTVVISELKGNSNSSSYILDNELRKVAFEKSPYKHPIIGYEEDIHKIDSKIMRDFYRKYYNPNNATVVVVGDFNEEKTLKLIQKYFGNIKNDNLPKDTIAKETLQKAEKRISVEKAGTTKLVEVAFHTPSIKEKDIYALNILEEILINGNKSKFKEALIEKGYSTDISGGQETYTDPGLFYAISSLTPDAKHKTVEKIILSEIEKLKRKPISEKELDGARNRVKAKYLFDLDGTYNQAVKIGYFEVLKDWQESTKWYENLNKVTRKDISNVLNKYFTKENRTVAYFIPELQEGQSYESAPIELGGVQHYKKAEKENSSSNHYSSLKIKDIENKHDREKITLSDGSTLIIYKKIDLPITYITGFINGGSSLLSKKDEWLADLAARTLEKGTTRHTKSDIENFLDSTGTEIGFSCDEESFRFSATSLNENVKTTADILTDILMNPKFPLKEIKKEKKLLLAEINESKDDPMDISRRNLSQLIYSENHPYYRNSFEKDIELIKKVESKDLKEAHEKLVRNNKAVILISTNLENEKLKGVISAIEKNLKTKTSKEIQPIDIPSTSLNPASNQKVAPLRDKYQSDVLLGHITKITREHPDFYKLIVANQVIGADALTSRIAKRVRDDSGLAYAAVSYLSPTHGEGEFGVYLGTPGDKVDKAVELVKEELKNIVENGITEEELQRAQKIISDSFVSKHLATKKKVTNTLLNIEFFNLGNNYINEYPKIIRSFTLNDINEAIKKHIHPDKLQVSIAGDYEAKVAEKALR